MRFISEAAECFYEDNCAGVEIRKPGETATKSLLIITFADAAGRFVASVPKLVGIRGGKSGQRRAPYFLTGSCS